MQDISAHNLGVVGQVEMFDLKSKPLNALMKTVASQTLRKFPMETFESI